jgi:hypothetical protein
MPLTDKSQDKVYLLPRTIDYYQKELTRLLEFERYGEAVKMLHFLQGCETGESETKQEWRTLLEWILTMFPEAREEFTAEQDEDLSEEDIFRIHLKERSSQEPGYAEKLLDVFRKPDQWEKQVLYLEQLRYLEHPDIHPVLLQWLQSQVLPPSLQFRALQILKLRGASGSARIKRNNQTYVVELSDVPTDFEEYPLPFQEILQRITRIGSDEGFPLGELAAQTWPEFIAYAYGTPLYVEVLTQRMEAWDAWAAAFHYTLLQTAQGEADMAVVKDLYGITGSIEHDWEKALQVFKSFAGTIFPTFA